MVKDRTQKKWYSDLNGIFNRAATKQCMLGVNCEPAAKNHGISEKRVLRKISEDGKVVAITPSDAIAEIAFGLKGTSQVSTFSAFCAKHDQQLFAPIDNNDYQPGNVEQEFLFAYRTIAQQYHIALASRRTQEAYAATFEAIRLKGEKLASVIDGTRRILTEDEVSRLVQNYQKRATDITSTSDGLRKLMRHLTLALLARNYEAVSTTVIELPDEYPIAQSSTVWWGSAGLEGPSHLSTVNIIPQQGRTYALLSCAAGHGTECVDGHLELFRVDGQVNYRAALTQLMCWGGESIAFKPSYWEALPQDLRASFNDRLNVQVSGGVDVVQFDGSFNILQHSIL